MYHSRVYGKSFYYQHKAQIVQSAQLHSRIWIMLQLHYRYLPVKRRQRNEWFIGSKERDAIHAMLRSVSRSPGFRRAIRALPLRVTQ